MFYEPFYCRTLYFIHNFSPAICKKKNWYEITAAFLLLLLFNCKNVQFFRMCAKNMICFINGFNYRLGETLEFKPVRQGDGGTYFCMAKNDVGSSDELSVTFDVLYRPRNVDITPKKLVDLDVGQASEFRCDSDANPPAQFEWLQKVPNSHVKSKNKLGQIYSRGFGKSMLLKNVTYEYEGKWVCVAKNVIKGNFAVMLRRPFFT